MASLHYGGTHIQHRIRVGMMLSGIFLALCGASAQQSNPTSGSFAQIVSGAGITTTITLVNTGETSAQIHLRFLTDEGNPLIMPVMLSQSGVSGGVDSVDQTISPNASLNIEVGNLTDLSLKVGSAHLASDGRVNGFAIFHIAGSGQEPIAQLETRTSSAYLFPFDESGDSTTGVAITNTTTSAVDVLVIAHIAGTQIGLGTVTLSALGHAAFVLDQRFPATKFLSGLIEFRTPLPGQIAAIGLYFISNGTVTTMPISTDPLPTRSSVAQIAAVAGVNTGIALVNIGSTDASLQVQFLAEDGSPLTVGLGLAGYGCSPGGGLASSVSRTISSGVTCGISAIKFGPSLVGSAQIATTGPLVGWVSYFSGTKLVQAPIENRAGDSFVLAFDHTNNVVTGLAIANEATQAAVVPVVIRDDSGTQIASGTVNLAAGGHSSFVLSQQFPITSNMRGTVTFGAAGGAQISLLGLRFSPTGAIATIPTLVP